MLQKGPLAISVHISQVLGKVIEGLHYMQSRACYNFLIQFNLLPGWPPVYKQLTIYSLWNWFPGIVECLLGLQMTDVCWSSQCCCSTEMRENLPDFNIFCKLLNLLVILLMKLSHKGNLKIPASFWVDIINKSPLLSVAFIMWGPFGGYKHYLRQTVVWIW